MTDKNGMTQEEANTVFDLIDKYGHGEILAVISAGAEEDSEDEEEICANCRRLNKRLHMELDLLIDRMAEYASVLSQEETGEESEVEGLNWHVSNFLVNSKQTTKNKNVINGE